MKSCLFAFQFRFQRGDALQQLIHLGIVVLRLFVEVAEGGVQVTVGGSGGLDSLRCGRLCLFLLAARIGEVEVRSVLRSRYLAVEHVAQLPDGTVAALLTLFHLPMLVGFQLVADNLLVRLVSVGHFGVVSVRSGGCSLPEDGANISHIAPMKTSTIAGNTIIFCRFSR